MLQVCQQRLTTSSPPCLCVWFIVVCDVSCGTVFLLLLFRDDDISPLIDVLEDFHVADVVDLWMIDDFFDCSTKSCYLCSLLSYTVTS